MRKLLGTVVLALFLCGNSFAASNNACSSDNWSWSKVNLKDSNGNPSGDFYAKFKINNKSSMVARITGYKFFTKGGKLIKKTGQKFIYNKGFVVDYVKPNDEFIEKIYLEDDFPWDITASATLVCSSITIDQYENELIAKLNKKDNSSSTNSNNSNTSAGNNNFDDLQKELYQGCYENAGQLKDQRAKEYCRCVTLMITDRYSESQILKIGKKSEAYQRSRFAFASKYCNLNAKARGDK
tara:strand:+ start:642 stop:1358 length:717 start_codon:yes stop_codon:yes gene_type:complete